MPLRITIFIGIVATVLCLFAASTIPQEKLLSITYNSLTKDSQKQVDCLAENIYYEAGYEPRDGKVAVAFVTINRTQDERFPKDICSVVKQKVKSTCQFTWFCEPRKGIREEAYMKAREVALHVYANYEKMQDITQGALYYHADYVNPRWKGLEQTTKIGRHIFYKERDST